MKLRVKILNIATKGPFIVIINEKTAELLGIEVLDRLKLRRGLKKVIVAVDFAYGRKNVEGNEIGLFLDVAEAIGIKENDLLDVNIVPKPESLQYIKKKLDKHELSKKEIDTIIRDLVSNELTEVESTYFVSACYVNG